MPKIIAIVGPTASGKSALGVFLAQKLGGEIISADSRQVYKGLNIGTGKVTTREMGGVPHHLLDVCSPKKQFTVDDFKKLAEQKLTMIYHSKKIPIVVGGTGLYVDVLLGRMTLPNVPPNPKLRVRLEKKSVEQLFAMLKKADPARAKTIEPKHKRRLIRALEIAVVLQRSKKTLGGALERDGAKPEQFSSKKIAYPERVVFTQPEILWLGLNPGEATLKKNIRARLQTRMKTGMVAEAKKLHTQGLSYKRMEALGLEYRYLAFYLQNKITKDEMTKQLERAIYKYAKRQMRWFKRNKDIKWIKNRSEALQNVCRFAGRAKPFLQPSRRRRG